jgi:predicted ATPase
LGEATYEDVLERHRTLIRAALASSGGLEVKTEGDGFFLAFDAAPAAIEFAVLAQRTLAGEAWPKPLRVRMGMHRGPAERRPDGDFVAMAVHQAARVANAASGGQVLVTAAAAAALPDDVRLERLGTYRLRDFDGPVELSQLTGPGLPATLPPPRAARADHGLKLPRTSLVGRDRELLELAGLLVDQPLITLVGTGGVGKTRVALEAAAANAALFPDGLHAAELSPVAGSQFVDATLAAAVGVRPEPGIEAIDALTAVIGDGRRLLVLDSCEHVLDGVALAIERLERDCPNVVVLATSTEPIRLPHERIVLIDPLALADGDDGDPMASDAVRLIVQRATDAGGRLGPTDDELRQIVEIARRLDGIPLALELAAGRIAERGVAQVLAALDDRFSLLTNGYRTALPRHRTLEAMVAWSVEQLKPDARELLERLSELQGSWEPAAALEVCSDDALAPSWLQLLIDRSLIAVDDGPPERVRLLDTVRAFASRALSEEDRAGIGARRLRWFGDRMAALVAETEDVYLNDIDALIPDIRATFTRELGEPIEAVALLAASCGAWFESRGLWTEGTEVFDALLADCPAGASRAMAMAAMAQLLAIGANPVRAIEVAALVLDDPAAPDKARALAALAGTPIDQAPALDGRDPLAEAVELVGGDTPLGIAARSRLALRKQIMGDAAGAADDLAGVIADARALGRPTLEAQALINRGGVLARLGQLDEAEAELEAGRALALERRQRSLAAGALTNLSVVALHRGDIGRALALAEARLQVAREMAEPRGYAAALSAVTGAAMAAGDLDRAREVVEDCLARCRELRFTEGIVTAGFNRVVIAQRRDGWMVAVPLARELLDDAEPTGNPALRALALLAAGGTLASGGLTAGVELVAAAEASTAGHVPLDPSDRVWLADTEAAVAGNEVAAAKIRGAALSVEAAFALARSALDIDR